MTEKADPFRLMTEAELEKESGKLLAMIDSYEKKLVLLGRQQTLFFVNTDSDRRRWLAIKKKLEYRQGCCVLELFRRRKNRGK